MEPTSRRLVVSGLTDRFAPYQKTGRESQEIGASGLTPCSRAARDRGERRGSGRRAWPRAWLVRRPDRRGPDGPRVRRSRSRLRTELARPASRAISTISSCAPKRAANCRGGAERAESLSRLGEGWRGGRWVGGSLFAKRVTPTSNQRVRKVLRLKGNFPRS